MKNFKKALHCFLLLLLVLTTTNTFSQSGSGWEWASTSTMATYSPGRQVIDIASDASGNIYVTGRFQGSMTLGAYTVATTGDGSVSYNFDEDAFVAKYNAAGVAQWVKKFGVAATGSNQVGEAIALDADGNVYIGGAGMTNSNFNSAFLVKYDNNGNLVWSKTDFLLYEIASIKVSADGNPIVMESNQSGKNIYKINKNTGAIVWTVNNTNVGSNGTSNYKDFVDDAGNIYYTCFNASAATTTVAGQTFTTTGLTSYVASIDNNGVTRWVQKIDNRQIQLGFTNDRQGNSYIQLGGGFGATFQGISTLQATQGGYSYFELNNAGAVSKYLTASPYKGPFKVKDDGIYGYVTESGGAAATLVYGDYFFSLPTATTKALGIVIKYNKTTGAVIWANPFEINGAAYNAGNINAIETTPAGKVVVGGLYGTSIKTGANTYTVATTSGSTPSDLFIAQFNPGNVLPPPTTSWTGNANNMLWNDANNWSNGIPNGNMKTNIFAGASNYPANIPTTVTPAKLEIGAGVTLQLPLNLSAPLGIVNNGIIEINESGTFYGGFNTGSSEVTGTGKIVMKNSATSFYAFKTLSNSLEINCPTGNVSCLGGTINGSLILTSGRFIGSTVSALVLSNPNATIIFSENSYYTGLLKRAVNTTGVYTFPVGENLGSSNTPLQVITLSLKNIVGPQYISVSYTKTINGSAPNTTAGGQNVTSLLNSGIFSVTPDVALTGGSYTVTLEARGFTNSVTDASRYVVLKRNNSSSAWAFFGNNGTATQAPTVVTATAGNITGFSDFAIGIAAASVATTLPVKYISFTAEQKGEHILLKWLTANELNNAYFNIQHSINHNDWTTVGKINTEGANGYNYSFTHTKPINGINYYRLQQVDKDGKASFGEIRQVGMAGKTPYVRIYPTPLMGNTLNIETNSSINAQTGYSIIDMNGRIVQSGTINATKSTVQLNNIAKGHYILRMNDGQTVTIEKL